MPVNALPETAGTVQLKWGPRPPRALSAAPSRLILALETHQPFGACLRRRVPREGARSSSRGGCAPYRLLLRVYG